MARRTSTLALINRGLATVVEERPPSLGRRELALLRPFLRPYRRMLILAFLLMLLATGAKLAGPIFLRYAFQEIERGQVSNLNFYGATFVATAVIGFLALRFSTINAGTAGESVLRDLRINAFAHLTSLSMGFFERERSGRLVARITSDIEAVERLVTENLVRIASETLFLIGAAIVLFLLDFKLALAAMSVLPVMIAGTFIFRRASERTYRQVRERVASVLNFIQETLRGVHIVQAFATERSRAKHFHEVNSDWASANVRAFQLEAYYFPAMEFLGVVGTCIVLIYGGFRSAADQLEIGVLIAFTVYLTLFFDPIHHLSEMYSNFQSAMAGLARVAQLLDKEPEIADSPSAVDLPRATGRVTFEKVTFSYARGAPPALIDVSFEVDPGTTAALVGPTGAGKSTIVKLLARFYDVTEGSVMIDGLDVRQATTSSLRGHIALVPQEGVLFTGTVMENIRFGKPAATDDEIQDICRRIGIDDFVMTLPEGYQTAVRERGSRLAAGEKQLIALARALVGEPSLVLLDEATSSLDSATEYRVEKAFRKALEGRTSVVIAHRLSTVIDADRIFVVEGGRIVEQGSHAELVARDGRYASLYSSWIAGTTYEPAD